MGDDGGGQLGQDDGDAVALGDAGGFQPVGEAVGQLGELAKCVSLDCAIKLLVNQSRLPSRLAVAAVDAEVVANGDAPLEVPLDLVDFAPAVALEQLRNPPCAAPFMARIVGAQAREGKGRNLPNFQPVLEDSYSSRFIDRARMATCSGTARTGSSSDPNNSVSRSRRWYSVLMWTPSLRAVSARLPKHW